MKGSYFMAWLEKNRWIEPSRTRLAPDRRMLIAGVGAAICAGGSIRPAGAQAAAAQPRIMPAQRRWMDPPAQAPAKEMLVELPGVKLWCWDTGGDGEPLVLMHPITGSGMIWGYQQPVFAKAGYRVIGYSRRGYAKSEAGTPEAPGTAVDDLNSLMDALKVGRFHLLGSAGGGFIAPDYALSHPDRVQSLILASSQGGVIEPTYRASIAALTPPGFEKLPESFRELGPSYRTANPAGAQQWEELERNSRSTTQQILQRPKNVLDWRAISSIRAPALVFTGAADLYMPAPKMLELASHIPGAETAIVSESGHSAYWEQPLAFNSLVLEFLHKHSMRGERRARAVKA